MNKKNLKVIQIIPSIIIYVFAGLLTIYAIWSYTYCADIITQARAAGQIATSGNEYDITSFYMSNAGLYFIYALLLAAAGLLLQRTKIGQTQPDTVVTSTLSESTADDDELDEWFQEEAPVDKTGSDKN